MKANGTGKEGGNRISCVHERKWVRDIKEGLDKEKKGTKKSGGRRSERGKSKGAAFFSWRAHVNE